MYLLFPLLLLAVVDDSWGTVLNCLCLIFSLFCLFFTNLSLSQQNFNFLLLCFILLGCIFCLLWTFSLVSVTLVTKLAVGLWVVFFFLVILSFSYRYENGSAYYHEDDREGLLKICRLVIHTCYEDYTVEGFNVLCTKQPVIYISSAARTGLGQALCNQVK